MQTYRASFGGTIWIKGDISQATEVYFNEKTAFHLKKFPSDEEPKKIVKALRENWHPNFANISPIFQVDGQSGYFLAFEKLGKSLGEFMKENKQLFFRDHLISEMYQQVLIELLRLFRHLLKLEVKGNLTIQNIFISGGAYCHITVIDYSVRVSQGGNSNWKELELLVRDMNAACGYAYKIGDMETFLKGLSNGYKNFFDNLHTFPLFWTLEMRRSLTCDVWDLVKDTPRRIFRPMMFGQSWELIIQNHSKLSKIKACINAFEALNRPKNFSRQVLSVDELSSRDCLALIRKSFAHFGKLKQALHDPDIQYEEDIQRLWESVFPDHIRMLRDVAFVLEATLPSKLVPEMEVLKDMWLLDP